MLDEFDVPNVEEIILDCGEPEIIASWNRIKAEIVTDGKSDKVKSIKDCPHRWKAVIDNKKHNMGVDWCYWCGSIRIIGNDGKEGTEDIRNPSLR